MAQQHQQSSSSLLHRWLQLPPPELLTPALPSTSGSESSHPRSRYRCRHCRPLCSSTRRRPPPPPRAPNLRATATDPTRATAAGHNQRKHTMTPRCNYRPLVVLDSPQPAALATNTQSFKRRLNLIFRGGQSQPPLSKCHC